MLKGSKRIFYGESLKRQVVRDYETGGYTYSRLSEQYGILGSSTDSDWCKKYGILAGEKKKRMRMRKKKSKKPEVVAENPPADTVKIKRSVEQDRISELEKALALSRQREQLYLRIITVSSEELGEDLLKKTGLRLLNPSVLKDG
jgi:transposase-like protein